MLKTITFFSIMICLALLTFNVNAADVDNQQTVTKLGNTTIINSGTPTVIKRGNTTIINSYDNNGFRFTVPRNGVVYNYNPYNWYGTVQTPPNNGMYIDKQNRVCNSSGCY